MQHTEQRDRKHSRRGNSLIEFSLLFPWYVFLFAGAFDCGLYLYSLMGAEGAVRNAAIYAASSATTAVDNTTACGYALDQLRGMPNIGMSLSSCNGDPLTVTTSLATGSATPDGMNAALVTVTYVTPQLIPIPGLLAGRLTITRRLLMRLRS